jgi:hypothetical protein
MMEEEPKCDLRQLNERREPAKPLLEHFGPRRLQRRGRDRSHLNPR